MKKKLFFILSLLTMVFTMVAFTSCGDDDDVNNGDILVTCKVVVDYDSNVDQATLAEIKACETALNQRLVKLCGKEFGMKYDETTHNIPNDAREAHAKKLYNDSEFHSLLEKLSKLNTADGKPGAVNGVGVLYYSAGTYLYTWVIE